jgi:hypothetical protein
MRWALAGLALGLLVAGWWWLRFASPEGTARNAAGGAEAGAGARAAGSAQRRAGGEVAGAGGTSARIAGGGAAGDGGAGVIGDPVATAEEIGRAREAMTTAAHACHGVAGRIDPTQSLRVRVAIGVAGGRAKIEDVAVVGGTLVDARARKCLADGFAAATWPSADDDRPMSVELELTLGELLH